MTRWILFRRLKLTAKGRALITKTFREHATAMEEAAGVLSKEERLILLRSLRNWERAGNMNLSGTVMISVGRCGYAVSYKIVASNGLVMLEGMIGETTLTAVGPSA